MKLVFIINGKGGVGKDSFIDGVATKYDVLNISSITPIKDIMRGIGWQGTKTDEDRKFMSDLKSLIVDYNDYPCRYCLDNMKKFLESDSTYNFMFIHIREPKEIEKLVKLSDGKCLKLLIRREEVEREFTNKSDNGVFDCEYDYVFNNDGSLEELPEKAIKFIEEVVNKEKQKTYPHSV